MKAVRSRFRVPATTLPSGLVRAIRWNQPSETSTRTLTVASPQSVVTFAGAVTGAAGLTKAGQGTLVLGRRNTFSGDLTASAGLLSLGDNAAAGTGTIVLNGGALTSYLAPRTLANAVTLAASSGFEGYTAAANLTLTGAVTVTGTNPTIDVAGQLLTTTFSGAIADAGAGFTKDGLGTLVLSGTNTFTGPLTVAGGILSVGADANLGAATAGLVLNGGSFQNTASFTLGASRTVAVTGTGTFNIANGTTLTVGAPITGAGSLAKVSRALEAGNHGVERIPGKHVIEKEVR